MSVIKAADAPRFELPGVEFTGLASPSRGSADLCTWRITVAPGVDSAPHTLDRDEVFMVTAGTLRVTPDGPELSAGDAVVVPAGEPIAVRNAGAEPAQAYIAIRSGFTPKMADGTAVDTPPWAR
ncbi:cupin domain-containing protein [Actinokineospora sp. HUAS TT18]|uniref:cupin domain-containing protein n=1 Tax=Actinokineospora sp. HUAS TT18 TaxID=3447451 RepID=UPI003F51B17A